MSDALTRHVVVFGRVLREAGLEVGPVRLGDALRGLDLVDLTRRDEVYFALRTTLVARREELEPFDRAFAAWFEESPLLPLRRKEEDPRRPRPGTERVRREAKARAAANGEEDPESVGWSAHEVLRHRDFAAMNPAELAAARKLMVEVAAVRPQRRSRRLRADRRGAALDVRRLARAAVATGGDPVHRRFRHSTRRPRKLVLLCDVSGSMEAYSRALLLFLHASVRSGRGVEVFAFGTRLTRLTPELRSRDPEQALARASTRVVDWAAGTRIGASLKEYNDVWGRRALTRGAVVVIVSDGWERDDHALVGREMARLHRAAYAVVWVNPLKGSPEYQPLAGGMCAALPHVDRFVAGHNLASLADLGVLLAGIDSRHAA